MPEPVNKELYARAKAKVNQTYGTGTSAYRSMAIIKTYKNMGGTYRDDGGSKKTTRWLNEKWVNLNAPKKGGGYEVCGKRGKDGKYPLCRPSKTVSKETPKKYQDISKSDIRTTNIAKQRIKGSGNISFLSKR